MKTTSLQIFNALAQKEVGSNSKAQLNYNKFTSVNPYIQ